jgi:hypothetical protein
MSQQQQQDSPEEEASSSSNGTEQQQLQPEAHAGQGSESIMKELRERENRRARHSGARRRNGPS